MTKWTLPLLFLSLCYSPLALSSIKNFDDKFSLAWIQEVHDFSLDFKPLVDTGTSSIRYEPNTTNLSGIQVSYKGITLAYLTPSPFSEESIELKGDTSYEDIRGGLFLGKEKQFVLLGYYNRFKGFYVANTAEVDPSSTEEFIKNSTMQTFNFGLGLMYIFSPDKFSAAAAFVQSDQQTKSGGSFLAMASFDTNIIKDVDGFSGVPSTVTSGFGDDQDFREGKFATTNATIGYAYTLVWRSFYANLTLLFGWGYQAREFTIGSEEISGTDNTTKQSFGYSFGYNGESFFWSAAYVQDDLNFETRGIKISPKQASYRVSLGVRF